MKETIKGSAKRIKQIRLSLKLSQSQFARKLGIATGTVARWEQGVLVPSRLAELAAESLPKPKRNKTDAKKKR